VHQCTFAEGSDLPTDTEQAAAAVGQAEMTPLQFFVVSTP
jgi:hypothetical protein